MKFSIRKTVPTYQKFPRWYGFAYRENSRSYIVVYPIPLNWIVGLWRRFKIFVMCGPDDLLDQAYEQGFRDGRQNSADLWDRKQERYDAEIKHLRMELSKCYAVDANQATELEHLGLVIENQKLEIDRLKEIIAGKPKEIVTELDRLRGEARP